ncbi:MAG: PAS sensor protein [Spirochaetes bacterium GWD1_61_31]|nr:MAG: PAS sensor protein [Spirochaetes bacterium GWB1_60_80]OHD34364.1 MAG: PAS sensor protein [Spirochaetes bacterium GWC1_61_12]OHD43138.1 MAG: PAS sensor protein [Spirochaetes bacterium GWD1_61_31]OHD44275.1 MAG: PAS sensor protein [Spirochaetes bacterium GWE1_60_18]OHD60442.1 MAG: PAS sensor protein [Spirochaetes bacterium GWF1_60_12]
MPAWIGNFPGAITVCDADLIITYLNDKALATWEKQGGRQLIGTSLLECHQPRSNDIIRQLLASGGTNVYTVQKAGLKKLIYQTAWKHDDGQVGGLVELSMVIPDSLPHYVRG